MDVNQISYEDHHILDMVLVRQIRMQSVQILEPLIGLTLWFWDLKFWETYKKSNVSPWKFFFIARPL